MGATQSTQTMGQAAVITHMDTSAGHYWAGAVAGAALGLAAGPLGAVAGAVAGYFVGMKTNKTTWSGNMGSGSYWSIFGKKIIGTAPPT